MLLAKKKKKCTPGKAMTCAEKGKIYNQIFLFQVMSDSTLACKLVQRHFIRIQHCTSVESRGSCNPKYI